MPSAQLLEALEAGIAARLTPLLMEAMRVEKGDLDRRMHGDSPPDDGPDDLTALMIFGNQITAYERRWRQRFAHPFAAWPDPPKTEARDAFSLVSDDELQAQLIGQPVIEALERRHVDILDTIDKRLWSLAASMGGQTRPGNPFAPRHVIESFLATFPASECGPRLRGALLRHYERLAAERLGEAYAWCNKELSDAGHAMASVSDYATLLATAVAGRSDGAGSGKLDLWAEDNALTPADSTWREKGRGERGGSRRTPGDAVRGNELRRRARARRGGARGDAEATRELRMQEFLAVLSLLQGEPAVLPDGQDAYESVLRAGLSRVAGGLGIEGAVPSVDQEDAIDLVGRLFDLLAARHRLSEAAVARLSRLALPYLRLALSDPYLFDAPAPPAMQVLARLVELWDGNSRASAHEAELHDLADEVAQQVVDDYHGDEAVFAQALRRLEEALQPLRKRAEISERRARQTIDGRERLNGARIAADEHLARQLQERPLSSGVAGFLQEQWRQSLVQAWLRDGPESERFANAAALGEEIVRLDREAARAGGAEVADRLIGMQQRLRDCYVACGLDESGAQTLLAQLVAEFANPDVPRKLHAFTPLSSAADAAAQAAAAPSDGLVAGQVVVLADGDEPVRALRLAWRSPLSGASLLVNAQGLRELLLSPSELVSMLGDGRLLPRPPEGPVESALRRMEADAGPAPA